MNEFLRDSTSSISSNYLQEYEQENFQRTQAISLESISSMRGDENDGNNIGLSEVFMKSEKKNSVKNVLKAFGNFVKDLENEDEILELVRSSEDGTTFNSLEEVKRRFERYNK